MPLCLFHLLLIQAKTSSLGQNISLSATSETDQCNNNVDVAHSSSNQTPSYQEDMDVPELVEEIIEMLLTGLRDTVCLKGEILL